MPDTNTAQAPASHHLADDSGGVAEVGLSRTEGKFVNRVGGEIISALADRASIFSGCGGAGISVAATADGSGSITGAVSVPDSGTRHSKASMRPVTGGAGSQ